MSDTYLDYRAKRTVRMGDDEFQLPLQIVEPQYRKPRYPDTWTFDGKVTDREEREEIFLVNEERGLLHLLFEGPQAPPDLIEENDGQDE